MFYLLTVATATLLITLGNFLYDQTYRFSAFSELLLVTLLGVVIVFAIDGLSAFIVRRLPERWFSPEARFFSVGKREKNLYRKLKINRWKHYVPEWGCFTGFHKDKLQSSNDAAYLARFLIESNYGVVGHAAGALLGFLLMFIPPLRPLSIALPVAAVNALLSLLPTMVLRFNTPALRRLYRRSCAEKTQENA